MDSMTFPICRIGILASALIFAAVMPFTAAATETCAQPTGEAVYSAWFKAGNGSHAARMRLVVSRSKGQPIAQPVAWIQFAEKSSACEAQCAVRGFDEEGPELRPTVRMTCRSAGLTALTAEATLLLPKRLAKNETPVLRFGTWLTGYQRIPLRVELDRLRQTLFAPKLASAATITRK